MNLIGPKSIASKLYVIVKILFVLAAIGTVLLSLAPVFPHSSLRYLSFDVRSGPIYVSVGLFRGPQARWWIWAMELVSRMCHALVLYLLMRILESAQTGEPFHCKTPNRLRWIACVVIVGSLLRTLFCAVLMNRGWGWRPEPGVWVTWAIDFDAIFMGLVLVALAEVFRRGYVLKTESELTV